MKALTMVRTAAMVRVGVGATLAIGTGRALRGTLRDEKPSGSLILFARTVGIRDALFGLGCLLSTVEPRRVGETRRWVQLWLANEVADVVAALATSRQLGLAGAASAVGAPLPLIAVDVLTLHRLRAATGGRSAG